VLDVMATSDAITGRDERALLRPRVHFPYLHTVPEREEGSFRRLLDRLAASHSFVSYSEGVERTLKGDIDRPYVAFSFDDGFASNVRTSRILEDYGTVGCFFVTTGFIGTKAPDEARSFFGDSADEPAMTWRDLEGLIARGHEVGNHTATHRRISDLSSDRVAEEIGGAADVLRSRLGTATHFAWPFGRFFHFTPEAVQVVFDTGHHSCASAERGSHPPVELHDERALCVRRDHLMTSWPLRHSRHFLAAGARRAESLASTWPDGWDPRR
jgi:peptidoglycan/xylan/chitin deacetylase (PgdA/CDA1 family)